MKTIVTLAIGLWIGRQIYLAYDKQKALQKQAEITRRLQAFLEGKGMSPQEAEKEATRLISATAKSS